MKTLATLLVIMLLGSLKLNSQTNESTLISSSGETVFMNEISMDWSLGEMLIKTSKYNNLLLTQGFHQPFPQHENNYNINTQTLLTYPNPARSSINLQWNLKLDCPTQIDIYNAQGILIKSTRHLNNPMPINISNYASGIYILYLWNAEKQMIGFSKFIKR